MTVEIFDSSATWTCPTGVTSVQVEGYGGGGGGRSGGSKSALGATGGGGGAYSLVSALS